MNCDRKCALSFHQTFFCSWNFICFNAIINLINKSQKLFYLNTNRNKFWVRFNICYRLQCYHAQHLPIKKVISYCVDGKPNSNVGECLEEIKFQIENWFPHRSTERMAFDSPFPSTQEPVATLTFNSKTILFLMFCFIPEHIYFCVRRGAERKFNKNEIRLRKWEKSFLFGIRWGGRGSVVARTNGESLWMRKIDNVEAAWKRRKERKLSGYTNECALYIFTLCRGEWFKARSSSIFSRDRSTDWVKRKWGWLDKWDWGIWSLIRI